jgi:hypothetical protein
MSKPVYWNGKITHCQITNKPLGDVMYDARLPTGQWGNIGQEAFEAYRCRLGVGFGQKYERQEDDRWLLIEGGMNDE